MSVYLMGAIWRGVDLPTNRRIILLKLADHGDDDGRKAWPAVGRLVHEYGRHRRARASVIPILVSAGGIQMGRWGNPIQSLGQRGPWRPVLIPSLDDTDS